MRDVWEIIEGDQGHILGNPQLTLLQSIDHAHGDGVVGSEDGGGVKAFVKQLMGHFLTGCHSVFPSPDQAGLNPNTRPIQRYTITGNAVLGC